MLYSPPGKHLSVWLDRSLPAFPKLKKNIQVDAVILGGGLAGLSSAYFLKKSGKKVAVLESCQVGTGVSGYTTAHVTSEHNLIYEYMIGTFGLEKAQLYADANEWAIGQIEKIIHTEKISCDWERNAQYLFAEEKKDLEKLQAEFEATKKLALPVSYTESNDLPFPIAGSIKYSDQAQFHPGKYIDGLAHTINGDGSYIFEETRALDVHEGSPCVVETDQGEIVATDVIVATHFPILDRGGFFARMKSMRSYVIGAYIEEELEAMYDDTYDPFHYIRTLPTAEGILTIIGGEDHDTGAITDTLACYQRLERYVKKHFTVKSFAYHWSSQDNYTYDRVPFIGRYTPISQHLYVATGFYGYGMTQSTIAGQLLTDLILQRENPLEKLYTPMRFHIESEAPKLTHTAIAMAKQQIKKIGESLSPATEQVDTKDMKREEGRVMEVEGHKVAIYRDEKGNLHAVSAVCQHQGCTLAFNNGEKSWDCPCHGSRFDTNGEILHSPTVKALPVIELPRT